MARRFTSILIPALFAMAALLASVPTVAAGVETTVASWDTREIIRGAPTQDVPEGGVNYRIDGDDTPARIVRVAVAVIWPGAAGAAPCGLGADRIDPTHRPCAAPPRAPPTA